MDAVLPREKPEVQSAAEQVGLEAGLAVAGDDLAFAERTFRRP